MRPLQSIFLRAATFTVIALLTVYGRAHASAIVVPDNFPPIQAVINAASPGDTIFQSVWGEFAKGDQTLLKNVVCRLRRKLEADPSQPLLLQTELGGYSFRG